MTILLWKECSTSLDTDDSVLQRADVRLVWAESADAFVPLVREHRPELVVLDQQMAGIDAFACAREIVDAFGTSVTVLLLGHAFDDDRAAAAGIAGIVHGPLTRKRLVEAVRRFRPISERESPRSEVAIKVQFATESLEGLAYTRDLSTGGCFLHAHEPLAVGASLALEFQLPGPGGRGVKVDGQVVRIQSQGSARGASGLAVRFTGIAAADRVEIRRFLRSRGRALA